MWQLESSAKHLPLACSSTTLSSAWKVGHHHGTSLFIGQANTDRSRTNRVYPTSCSNRKSHTIYTHSLDSLFSLSQHKRQAMMVHPGLANTSPSFQARNSRVLNWRHGAMVSGTHWSTEHWRRAQRWGRRNPWNGNSSPLRSTVSRETSNNTSWHTVPTSAQRATWTWTPSLAWGTCTEESGKSTNESLFIIVGLEWPPVLYEGQWWEFIMWYICLIHWNMIDIYLKTYFDSVSHRDGSIFTSRGSRIKIRDYTYDKYISKGWPQNEDMLSQPVECQPYMYKVIFSNSIHQHHHSSRSIMIFSHCTLSYLTETFSSKLVASSSSKGTRTWEGRRILGRLWPVWSPVQQRWRDCHPPSLRRALYKGGGRSYQGSTTQDPRQKGHPRRGMF